MKLIFLDVDGVLNCAETFEQRRDGNIAGTIFDLDPRFVKRFKKIVKETGVKVVLSSTWRLHEDTRQAVRNHGIEFIDCTPYITDVGTKRGREINAWLSTYTALKKEPIEKFCILDDDSDMLPGQPFFQTSWKTGLTAKIAKEVINYFNGND